MMELYLIGELFDFPLVFPDSFHGLCGAFLLSVQLVFQLTDLKEENPGQFL